MSPCASSITVCHREIETFFFQSVRRVPNFSCVSQAGVVILGARRVARYTRDASVDSKEIQGDQKREHGLALFEEADDILATRILKTINNIKPSSSSDCEIRALECPVFANKDHV